MSRLLFAATIALAGLTAAPAFAGGFTIDLPRLDFPTPTTTSTRACQDISAPNTCTAPKS